MSDIDRYSGLPSLEPAQEESTFGGAINRYLDTDAATPGTLRMGLAQGAENIGNLIKGASNTSWADIDRLLGVDAESSRGRLDARNRLLTRSFDPATKRYSADLAAVPLTEEEEAAELEMLLSLGGACGGLTTKIKLPKIPPRHLSKQNLLETPTAAAATTSGKGSGLYDAPETMHHMTPRPKAEPAPKMDYKLVKPFFEKDPWGLWEKAKRREMYFSDLSEVLVRGDDLVGSKKWTNSPNKSLQDEFSGQTIQEIYKKVESLDPMDIPGILADPDIPEIVKKVAESRLTFLNP